MKKYPEIDTHYHLGTTAGGCNREKALLEWMDQYEIDIQIIMQMNEGTMHATPKWNPCIGNDFIGRIQKKYPKKIIGLGGVLPWWQPPKTYLYGEKAGQPFDRVKENPVMDELERIVVELGLYGLKVHPFEHHYQINNPYIMFPIYKKLEQLSKKVNRKLIIFIHAASDDIGNTPEGIADAARRYPNLTFIVSHSGYPRAIPTLVNSLADLPNVMLDLTTVAAPKMLTEAYRVFGATRFTAGSDGPFASGTMKKTIVECLTDDEEERALILGGNLMNLWELE